MTDSSAPAPAPRTGTPPDPEIAGAVFRRLCEVVAQLRSPEGCPWDREQTLATIKPFTLEETYELLDAIDSGNDGEIVEELGDVLLQVLLDAQIGADEGRFGLVEVMEGITAKLIRRHPHVFGEETARNADDVKRHWDRIKSQEKRRDSRLDGLPAGLPQLARAARITEKAAKVGYDFPQREMLFAKLREEIDELRHELALGGELHDVPADVTLPVVADERVADPAVRERIEDELGDVLFVLANIARRWGIAPEEALRRSNAKFERRFRYIESAARAEGREIGELTLIEMEALYQRGKALERQTAGERGSESHTEETTT